MILSVALITGVTTFISSLNKNMIESTIVSQGDWHVRIDGLNSQTISELKNNSEVEELMMGYPIGYAKFNNIDKDKPYLFIAGFTEQLFDKLPMKKISGRLPKNDNEIIISDSILRNNFQYKIGDSITVEIGKRIWNGDDLWQNSSFVGEESGEKEEFVVKNKKTYTIVGVYDTPIFNDESAVGYPIFTYVDNKNLIEKNNIWGYIKLRHPRKVYDFASNYKEFNIEYNSWLLMYMGISNMDYFNKVLYSLGGITIFIIMIGSMLLIYNAFFISVSERTKQFGMLSSIGATEKQLFTSVIFEAGIISIIGIPIGVLVGITGIGITMYFVGDALISSMDIGVFPIQLYVSPIAIIVTIITAIITIFASVYIPAHRAAKYSAMDAIRQTKDISIKNNNIKSSKFIYKFFGFEGAMAERNFRGNLHPYRSTITSLIVSIVIFVSTSALTMYLKTSIGEVVTNSNYDILYMPSEENSKLIVSNLYPKLTNIAGITDMCMYSTKLMDAKVETEMISSDYLQHYNQEENNLISVHFILLDDMSYKKYAKDVIGEDDENFQKIIAINSYKMREENSGRFLKSKIIKEQPKLQMELVYDGKEANIVIDKFTDIIPVGISDYYGSNLLLISSDSYGKKVFGNESESFETAAAFKARNPKEVLGEMEAVIASQGKSIANLYNISSNQTDNRNLILSVSVFSYGFIIIISLIAVANVFNTISTNINLRRKEFAMLKSVGMGEKSFYKMIRFECIFYGLKSLLLGLPISIIISYGIYKSIEFGMETTFVLPWMSILISIFSVFFVVIISMLYAIKKAKSESIIDALKNDNL